MMRSLLPALLLALACQPSPPPPESGADPGSSAEAAEPSAPEPSRPPPPPPEPPPLPEGPVEVAPPPQLLRPEEATATAPEFFVAELETTKGTVHIEVHRDWAPKGADRFFNLVQRGYFHATAFFRVVSGFMAQIGIHGHPAVNAAWRNARIEDDPVKQTNTRGTVSFATSGPNSRTTQFFINFADNSRLDGMGFAPFGRVRNMDVVDKLYAEYGEGAPAGRGPMQGRMQTEGNAYLKRDFPELDYILVARIVDGAKK
jgi:peptidyl-prolyl cis-trans isomerase A (cyclophilin A)